MFDFLTVLVLLIIFWIIVQKRNDQKYRRFSSASGNQIRRIKKDKGVNGEFQVFHCLEHLNVIPSYLLPNLIIPKQRKNSTEVDIVMVSTKGIFVFESKNYSGWLFGDQKKRYWTQTFPSGRKNNFFNPLWQNEGHIEAIKDLLGRYDRELFRSYVVFSGDCVLKRIRYDKATHTVIKIHDLERQIRRDLKDLPEVFTAQEAGRIFRKLEPWQQAETGLRYDLDASVLTSSDEDGSEILDVKESLGPVAAGKLLQRKIRLKN